MEHPAVDSSRHDQRTARAEAAAWIVRLHGPFRSPELIAGFRAWLAANPENARQFERVTEVWDAGSTPVQGVPRVARWREAPRSRGWAVAALLLVVCGVAAWALNELWLNPSYATRLGEQRVVRLKDGTRVSLNSNTRIQVAYNDAQRGVRLARGEALFEVARDPQRPFRVAAGDHQVTALGTTFVVRHEPDRTAVTLVEGKVTVRSGAASAPPGSSDPSTPQPRDAGGVVLAPGERLTFAAHASAKRDAPSLDAITAWRRGEVMLDRTALADAVAEMNRYDETTLVIDDASVAAIRVSGIYHVGDSEIFAETVARLYGLEVVRQGNRIHLRLPATGGSSPEGSSSSPDN